MRRALIWGGVTVLVVFVIMQLVPYRVTNPPVVQEPTWDSAQTASLVRAACYDCHSHESNPYVWEKIAPISWLVTKDVREGRDKLNFSECRRDDGGDGGDGESDAGESVRDGDMPPGKYTMFGLHSEAKLDAFVS